MQRSHLWIAATLTTLCSAQDDFLAKREAILAGQPSAVSFTVSAPKSDYYLGEPIRLTLSYTSAEHGTFIAETRTYDRVGRLNFVEEYTASPSHLVEDPLQGIVSGMGMGGASGGPIVLSAKPYTLERVLNEWVRFRQPGQYRLYVTTSRVSRLDQPAAQDQPTFPVRSRRVTLASNVLTLTIRTAPPNWIAEQITSARETLLTSRSPNPDKQELDRVENARLLLRHLPSLEAAKTLVELSASDRFFDSLGILASPYRKELLPMLEQRLTAPDQPVTQSFLRTLARLATIVEVGLPPARYASVEQARAEGQRRNEVEQRKRAEYAKRLTEALPAKQPGARAESLNTLQYEAPAPATTQALIADFRNLPPLTQYSLLESRWDELRGPGMLPALRDIVANAAPDYSQPSVTGIALRRLYELDPAEGRRIILAELKKPQGSSIPFSVLAMLPDAALPELNEVLLQRFDDRLILRYATSALLPQVKQAFETRITGPRSQNVPACVGPLVFWFLKHDPDYGRRVLLDEFSRDNLAPACYDIGSQFLGLGPWAWSPALERIAIESLTSPKVPVKHGAAEVLGKYGSTAAQKPLWETMEYFRSWWKGRESELTSRLGQESLGLERALRIALATASNWVLTAPELSRLRDLCSSDTCRAEVDRWIAAAPARPR